MSTEYLLFMVISTENMVVKKIIIFFSNYSVEQW